MIKYVNKFFSFTVFFFECSKKKKNVIICTQMFSHIPKVAYSYLWVCWFFSMESEQKRGVWHSRIKNRTSQCKIRLYSDMWDVRCAWLCFLMFSFSFFLGKSTCVKWWLIVNLNTAHDIVIKSLFFISIQAYRLSFC